MSKPSTPPFHVAIVMDGNGRWATSRGLPRIAGHKEGARAVRRVVEAVPDLGITTLTLYAFSSDNWKRPRAEVSGLMSLFRKFLIGERDRCAKHGIRLGVIGRRDRLDPALLAAIRRAEAITAGGRALHLRIAVDYSARHAIALAARSASPSGAVSFERFRRLLNRAIYSKPAAPDVDLLIRTGGERRLSDFMLWEAAYAELVFTDRMWPEFGRQALVHCVEEFRRRDRRFGVVKDPAAAVG